MSLDKRARALDQSQAKKSTAPRDDLRVRRTRLMLREALLALLKEKEFDSISIRELTARAKVRRSTFYLHYQDKDAFITQLMKEMLDELSRNVEPVEGSSQEPTWDAIMRWFQHAAAHAELYHILLGRSGMRAHAIQMRSYIEKLMLPLLEERVRARDHAIPVEIQSRFLASAFMGVLEWWLGRRQPSYSAQEMGQWLLALSGSSLLFPPGEGVPR